MAALLAVCFPALFYSVIFWGDLSWTKRVLYASFVALGMAIGVASFVCIIAVGPHAVE
jgi:hypothetical protein